MVYKLANPEEVVSLPSIDPAIHEILMRYTTILSTQYGTDRDVDHGDGGYVLYATEDTDEEELRKTFLFDNFIPELVQRIESTPAYTCNIYLLSSDYGIVLVAPVFDERLKLQKETFKGELS